MSGFETYRDSYRFLRMRREDGVLELALHKDGGAAAWSAFPGGLHAELGDAFYRIGRDPDNRVVILTGTGDEFLTKMDWSENDPVIGTAQFWDRIYKEGKDLLMTLLDIEVPVIGAVNGPAFVHAELIAMSDLVLASDRAVFADKRHAIRGVVPGDGSHIWWPMVLGPNRGRQFLWTGMEIGAEEAKALGFVAEVVPHAELGARAWALARELARQPTMMLRYTRVSTVQHIKRRMLDDLGYGLQMEALAGMSTKPPA